MKPLFRYFFRVNCLTILLIFNFQLFGTDIFDITCSGDDVIDVTCGNAISGQLFVDGQGVFDDVIYYNCDCQHPTPSGCPSPGSESQKLYLEKVFKITPTGNVLTVSVNNHARMVVYFASCSGNGFCDQISSTVHQDRRIYELDLSESNSFDSPIYVVIDGFNTQSEFNSPINYDIEFTCSDSPDPEFTCDNAETLECDKSVSSTNVGSPNNTNSYGCITGANSTNFTGGEKVFKFTPALTDEYEFTLSNFSGDLDLLLLSSCNPQNCLTNEGASEKATEKIKINLDEGKLYYVVVDGFNGNSSSFNLVVTCPQESDPCEEAQWITCGNTYLSNTTSQTNKFNSENYPCYTSLSTFNGKDKIFKFEKLTDHGNVSITLYHNSGNSKNLALFLFNGCPDETNCLGSKGIDIFSGSNRIGEYWTDAGNPLPKGTYYIVVDGPSPSIFSPFKITLNCENPSCTEVETIQLGETKLGETNLDGSNQVSAYDCNESLFGYTGKEKLYQFSLTTQKTVDIELTEVNAANFDLFLLEECNTNSCMYYSNQPTGEPEKIGPVILQAGTYYVIVDVKNTSALTKKEDEGTYNLSLKEKKKSTNNCTACDGVVDPDWYNELIDNYTNCCLTFDESEVSVNIYQCTYKGQTVIHIPPTSCNDSYGLVYDCNGNLILSYPFTDTLILQNCRLIWSCKGDDSGCDFEEKDCELKDLACGGNSDSTWLINLQNELVNCCSEVPVSIYQCTYQGIPAIHVPPLSCGQTDDQGDVYDCEGTVLFNYGGIDGNYNRDKLKELEDCQLLWSCQENTLNCSSEDGNTGSNGECSACDGAVNETWYDELVKGYADCCQQFEASNVTVKIYQCSYLGQTVLHVPPTSCNDSQGLVYDCNGTLLFWYTLADTSKIKDLKDCQLIWSCEGNDSGCDFEEKDCELKDLACGGNSDSTWLINLQNELVNCCSDVPVSIYQCTYQGIPAIHVPPISCGQTDDQGDVYDCEGTVLFNYGGIDGNYNRDKLKELEDCQLLWSCQDNTMNCSSEDGNTGSNGECSACDGAVNETWYDELVKSYADCCQQFEASNVTVKIYQCSYLGQTVLHIPPTSCNDSQGLVYDCNGTLLFWYTLADTSKIKDLKDCQLIWSCEGADSGCDFEEKDCTIGRIACNGEVNQSWMSSLQANLLSCCATHPINIYQCNYEGQTAIHVPPLSCDQTDDQGDVYRCDGTLLFNYGGINPNFNLNKLNDLQNCQLLWSCKDSNERCQDPEENLLSTQTIVLKGGWNMISTYLIPEKSAMNEIFSDLKEYIDIVKDENGNTYIPSFGIDNIGNWDYTEGYQVKLNIGIDTAHLKIRGRKISKNQNSIDITPGWNIIAYLCNRNSPVARQFAAVRSKIILMKNNAGDQFIPSFMINNIKCMEPGQGYKVKVRRPITDFSYNCTLSCNNNNPANTNIYSDHYSIPSDNNATIILPGEVAKEILNPGQILAVTDLQGNIYGQGVFQNRAMAVTIWGDDPHTEFSEGFTTDASFSYLVIDPNTKKRQDIHLEFSKNMNYYTKDHVYEVTTARKVNQKMNSSQDMKNLTIFPNPTSSSFILKVGSSTAENVMVDFIDSNGKMWKEQYELSLIKGMNSIQIEIGSLTSGVYTIRLFGRNGAKFGKLVVIR